MAKEKDIHMQVKVNCKKKAVDFSANDFRSVVRSRYAAKKTVTAQLAVASDGTMSVDTGKQVFEITPSNTKSLAFFVDGDRTYIEAVINHRGKNISFLIAPVEDNLTIWTEGVVNLRTALTPLAQAAGIAVNEIIDPNPLGVCPDGIYDMDAFIEQRLLEGADILYTGQDDNPEHDYEPVEEDIPTYDVAPTQMLDDGEDSISDWEDVLGELDDVLGDEASADMEADYPAVDTNNAQYDFLYDPEAYTEPVPLPDDGYYADSDALDSEDSSYQDYIDSVIGDDDDWMADVEDIYPSEIANDVEEIKTNAADAMDEAYGALTGLRASLEEERARRINEMHRLAAELAGTEFIPPEPVASPEPLVPEPVVIESEEPAEVADALRAELDNLDGAVNEVDVELNEYDRIITESRRQQQELMDSLDSDIDRDAVVAGLINMYQEQTEFTEQINTLFKKEQVLKHKALEQRDEAYQTIDDQKNELDKLRRSLRFSERSKRKSEQFLKDAKREVHATVLKARDKVEEAIAACEQMQEQVDQAEARATSADERRSAAELARIEAYRVRDEALQELEDEKKNSQALLEACDRQLNEFIEESVNKIQLQIERANAAEQSANAAESKVSELENELAETKARLLGYESKCSKNEVDIEQLRKQRDQAESRVSNITAQYQNADTQRKETGRILSETEAELVRARASIKQLTQALNATKEAKDAAVSECQATTQRIIAQCEQQVREAVMDKNTAIENLTGAKDNALAANQQFITAMSTALSLPDGFGSRKKKLDAIADAYNSFVFATQSAAELGNVSVVQPYQDEEMEMTSEFGMKSVPQQPIAPIAQ